MEQFDERLNALAVKLFHINAFKFGEFTLKSGISSPVYFDLRVIISYPEILEELSTIITDVVKHKGIEYDHICGVPYTALPIATVMSIKSKKPMVICRKETKSYGTKKLIEGEYKPGDKCLIIEDIITSGSSVLETAKNLRNSGLKVLDVVVFVDREQGGAFNIKSDEIRPIALFKLNDLVKMLHVSGIIAKDMIGIVSDYVKNNQLAKDSGKEMVKEGINNNPNNSVRKSYGDRCSSTQNVMGKKLLSLMERKKTNLCLAADVTNTDALLKLIEKTGPYICLLKTHVDILEDFTDRFVEKLLALAKQYDFLIMEDRKFSDIGNTVRLQYNHGVYRISKWADFVTVHSISGPSVVQSIKSVIADDENKSKFNCIFLLAEMSSAGNLIDSEYIKNTMKIAEDNKDLVAGIVCQNRKTVNVPDDFIQLTPGVSLEEDATNGDGLGQQYNSPDFVMNEGGADCVVVGRAIYRSKDPAATAKLYRDALWAAYHTSLNRIIQ